MMREAKRPARFNWKLAGMLVLLGAVCVSTAMAAFGVRHYVTSDARFNLSRQHPDALTIQGLAYTPRVKVERVFAGDFGRSVFSIPLDERRRRLLAIDWVEDATVSRIWPDRLVVRVRERRPIAFAPVRGGILLIDAYGVLLDPPPQARFAFPVLSGVREDQPEAARRECAQLMLRVVGDLGYMAKQVSEVNVADPETVRIVAEVEGHAVELILGGDRFATRFQSFLGHYPEIRKGSPEARFFDLRLDDRITVKE
jgi:cell division protein FtsQ